MWESLVVFADDEMFQGTAVFEKGIIGTNCTFITYTVIYNGLHCWNYVLFKYCNVYIIM